ncbi:hypothetical protein INR49_018581 [Caranx melampygus]|nr:hypothetical protein INR49_018581 [Caranx melampygus]
MAGIGSSNYWEDLRKQARQLENELDLKLVSFSKLCTSYSSSRDGCRGDTSDTTPLLNNSTQDRMFDTMSVEIEQLLAKLTAVNDKMAEYTNAPGTASLNAALMHTLQRHRDILQDYTHEFHKTKGNFLAIREREDLLGRVGLLNDQKPRRELGGRTRLAGNIRHCLAAGWSFLPFQVLEVVPDIQEWLWGQQQKNRAVFKGARAPEEFAVAKISETVLGKTARSYSHYALHHTHPYLQYSLLHPPIPTIRPSMPASLQSESSDRLMDDTISIAMATKENMTSQRGMLKSIQSRVNTLASILYAVYRINLRKRRDSLILGTVIGVCTILLLLYAFH